MNGLRNVVACFSWLYANSARGRNSSQVLKFFLTSAQSSVERLWLTTSVCPSVCGCDEDENNSLMLNLAMRDFQRQLMNLTFPSETMLAGIPCKRTISLKNKVATCEASPVLLHGIK
jgi:hypothetical protein